MCHTVLSNACKNGLLDEVKYLISVGVDVNYRNGYALYAAFDNRFEICKVLIEAGININYIHECNGWTPLHNA